MSWNPQSNLFVQFESRSTLERSRLVLVADAEAGRPGRPNRPKFPVRLAVVLSLLVWSTVAIPAKGQDEIHRSAVIPTVAGPIAITRSSYPFMSAAREVEPVDLGNFGYAEAEYLVSGKANVYDYGADGRLRVLAPDAPYTTRILVRRPVDPRRFSGNVVVELLNPSDKFDADLIWELTRNYEMEHGDAYVGITSKPVAAAFLQKFDPKRYAALSWANPIPLDQTCKNPGPSLLPGHSSPSTEDGLIWDIVTQVGALLKNDDPKNPLGGLQVRYLYQTAYSQTGAYVGTYISLFQPNVRLSNGKPVYDGFLIGTAAGVSTINQCASPLKPDDSRSLVRSPEPIIRIMTLTDFYRFGPFLTYRERRADSDAADDRYRLYEIAGAAHVVTILDSSAPSDVDVSAGGLPRERVSCKEAESDFPSQYIFDGALANLERWVRDGKSPPNAKRIAMSKPGDPSAVPLVDEFGNVKGGVRSPYVDVPVATYYGTSTATGTDSTPPTCPITGHIVPFDHGRLARLYPTHADYTRRVDADVDRLVSEGWITRADGQRIKDQTDRAAIP